MTSVPAEGVNTGREDAGATAVCASRSKARAWLPEWLQGALLGLDPAHVFGQRVHKRTAIARAMARKVRLSSMMIQLLLVAKLKEEECEECRIIASKTR